MKFTIAEIAEGDEAYFEVAGIENYKRFWMVTGKRGNTLKLEYVHQGKRKIHFIHICLITEITRVKNKD